MQVANASRAAGPKNVMPATNAAIPLSASQFRHFQTLLAEYAGIDLLPTKQSMVQRRLSPRLVAMGLSSFDEYAAHLIDDRTASERVNFVNALTTNKTDFFREAHHFDYLRSWLSSRIGLGQVCKPLRMWSAGCSTGQEAYSMAMTAADVLPYRDYDQLKILATDIDTQVLNSARRGVYAENELAGLPPSYFRRFVKSDGSHPNCRIAETCKSRITFNQLNLNGPWPITTTFDTIFCRNVIIYFSKPTQAQLFEKFAQHLKPDGRLFLGHSESIFRVSSRFVHIGQNIYRKAD